MVCLEWCSRLFFRQQHTKPSAGNDNQNHFPQEIVFFYLHNHLLISTSQTMKICLSPSMTKLNGIWAPHAPLPISNLKQGQHISPLFSTGALKKTCTANTCWHKPGGGNLTYPLGEKNCCEFLMAHLDGVFTSEELNTKDKVILNAYYDSHRIRFQKNTAITLRITTSLSANTLERKTTPTPTSISTTAKPITRKSRHFSSSARLNSWLSRLRAEKHPEKPDLSCPTIKNPYPKNPAQNH